MAGGAQARQLTGPSHPRRVHRCGMQDSLDTTPRKHLKFLYRILPFRYLVEIFEKRALSFSCPRSWEDPYESVNDHKILASVFAQCWCRLSVSDAMWRIYSADRLSVRIKTTLGRLRAQVRAGLSDTDRFQYEMREVDYKRTTEVEKVLHQRLSARKDADVVRHAFRSLFFKRKAFRHEAEYRVVVFDRRPDDVQDRLLVHIDPHRLILSVLANPRADDTTVQVYKFYLHKKLHFRGGIAKSALYETIGASGV